MEKTMDLNALVAEFAENVAAQTDAIWRGDPTTGNKHAKRSIAAFQKLRTVGDVGREALCALLVHERPDVRAAAAAVLLRYRTTEALEVLRAIAGGAGLVPLQASEAIRRWQDGTWALDLA